MIWQTIIDFLKLLSDFDENMESIILLISYCLTLWLECHTVFIQASPWSQVPKPVS